MSEDFVQAGRISASIISSVSIMLSRKGIIEVSMNSLNDGRSSIVYQYNEETSDNM